VKRTAFAALAALWLGASPALACVGKTIVIGADRTPRGRFAAQVLAILINERTGTTVKIADFPDAEAVHRGLAAGDVDIAVEYANRALARMGLGAGDSPEAAVKALRGAYQEKLNLAWLQPLGFTDSGDHRAPAATVVRKDTLKKFPALPRLLAKTEGVLPDTVIASLTTGGDAARSAREFLRNKKLI
jgi:osmoprotectant transport system substrate-binding protein